MRSGIPSRCAASRVVSPVQDGGLDGRALLGRQAGDNDAKVAVFDAEQEDCLGRLDEQVRVIR
ncbi:hypothetical protein [Nonomuraea solani]|uniref:hypothetical protein n=1 Tax=Nonomuraea solani TaxID=1144553 RepID=UPI001F163068|nr:hypothetical protein [Nonomuraea solani]